MAGDTMRSSCLFLSSTICNIRYLKFKVEVVFVSMDISCLLFN